MRWAAAWTTLRTMRAGMRYAYQLPDEALPASRAGTNPLEAYFDSVTEGPGIWKWRHYFPIYHRHLERFRGRAPHVVEIGIYSGGSLPMWLDYFGDGTHVYGVDIEPACRAHETTDVSVFIGDQADPGFWRRFTAEVPRIDVVIDDGGHEAHQQIESVRSLLPHLAPGGVYVCEDIAGELQQFHSFVDGLTRTLSDIDSDPRAVHRHVASVHRYPGVTVIEKPERQMRFESVKHGTVWQPGIY